MLSKDTKHFTKDNLDMYLKELAKEFRKLNGKTMPAEIILVGGASVLATTSPQYTHVLYASKISSKYPMF